jgi:protein-S-isoprenylcysteine O-methyltransferase Ste14
MNEQMSSNREITTEVRHGIVKWGIKATVGIIVYGLILFLSAGTLTWIWGWIFLGVLAIHLVAHPLLLLPRNPELLAEREKGFLDKEVKHWDKRLTSLAGGLMIFTWVVAGLDYRFQWTGELSSMYHIGGLLITILGYGLFMWAMTVNAFFSEGVRIQKERGQVVVTNGPYEYVRHPGYVGTILTGLGTPLLLGSVWAVVPAIVLAGVMVERAWLEDRMLTEELAGYKAYAQQTQARLLPGVW